MSVLVLRPAKGTAGDGYQVFRSEGDAFAARHRARIVEVPARKMAGTIPRAEKNAETMRRRASVLSAIRSTPQLRMLAVFSHGWRTGSQLAIDRDSVAAIAEAIADATDRAIYYDPIPIVALYACSCGAGQLDSKHRGDAQESGDGGLADELRDALCRAGATRCRVDAHATVGHASRNPYVRRFEGAGSPVGGTGGSWIVAPQSVLWKRWIRALRGDLRLRFPLLDVAAIHHELLGSDGG